LPSAGRKKDTMSPNQNAHQVLVVIGGTLLLVLALSTLTDKLNGAASRFYSNVLLAVYKELTIIGVVALLLICLEEVAHPAPDLVHVFHVVHLSVLMVAAVHIGVASLVATSRKRCECVQKALLLRLVLLLLVRRPRAAAVYYCYYARPYHYYYCHS
jgi:hypothetical protein